MGVNFPSPSLVLGFCPNFAKEQTSEYAHRFRLTHTEMPHDRSDTTIDLETIRTQLDGDVRLLRAIWLGLARTHAVIEHATLAYKQSLELLNPKDHRPPGGRPAS